MFKNLTDFSFRRSGKEAVGFYLAYLLVGLIVGGIGGAVAGLQAGATTFSEGLKLGLKIGPIIAMVYSIAISLTVLLQRKLYTGFGYIVLVLCSGLFAAFGGLLLGLLVPAFMTTRDAGSSEEQRL